MSCQGNSDCTCGCCSGISVQTPQGETNLPGLSAIAYRTGTWAMFRESMLARLSSSDYPALAYLKSRDNDDFSIALLDASAVMMDILTFYQERLANESYLRTATQLDSLAQLSRLIGYRPSPGVSASTYLAFTLTAAPGQPENPGTTAITIPVGTQVQSVPAQGQTPQSFQTSADILGKPDWNAMPVQTGRPWVAPGTNSIYLSGKATQLQPGDSLLILGNDREYWDPASSNPSEQWDVVVLNKIEIDTARNLTFVSWLTRLDHGSGNGTSGNPSQWTTAKVFAFRQKVVPFGGNAPSPNLFVNAHHNSKTSLPDLIDDTKTPWVWKNYEITDSDHVDLGSPCSKIVAGSWFALTLDRIAQLYKVKQATSVSLSSFGLSGKVTELAADYADPYISAFSLPRTEIWAQSEQLPVAEQPLDHPLYGTLLDLEVVRQDLVGVTAVAVSGKRQKVAVNPEKTGPVFTPDDGSAKVPLNPCDILTLLQPPAKALRKDGTIPDWTGFHLPLLLNVSDESGRSGTVDARLSQFTLAASSSNDPVAQEFALVASVMLESQPFARTRIVLKNPPEKTGLWFTPDDDSANKVPLNPGDILTLLQPPAQALCEYGTIPDWTGFHLPLLLNVSDESGRSGTVDASLSQFTLVASSSNDPVVQEFALVASVNLEPQPFARTRIVLKNPLTNCYDRTVTSVNANVGPATAGRPVMELLGSGSAATTNQAFTLKQSPLTYVQAATPTGSASSLKVSANGVAWSEVQSLYNQSPSAQVYETLNLPGGTAKVQFGDNVEGATLPTGQSNIVASFRVGLGSAGNVAAGAITTLVDRPLGVTGVTNPMAATGGQDAQSIENIRVNAPQSVLTLGRAVSITDYQNFAATFAGIAKAHAIWIPNGPHRGVFLTVAGVDGIALDGSQTLANLVAALEGYGNPNVAIYAQSFYETVFGLSADIAYDLKYDAKTVKAKVLSLLSKTYCFASRTFGQGVSADEITALIQGVEGIVAANVTRLKIVATSAAGDLGSAAYSVSAYNNWVAQKKPVQRPHAGPARICPYVPVAVAGALPAPAEILVLDPDPAAVVLGVMT